MSTIRYYKQTQDPRSQPIYKVEKGIIYYLESDGTWHWCEANKYTTSKYTFKEMMEIPGIKPLTFEDVVLELI